MSWRITGGSLKNGWIGQVGLEDGRIQSVFLFPRHLVGLRQSPTQPTLYRRVKAQLLGGDGGEVTEGKDSITRGRKKVMSLLPICLFPFVRSH